MMRDDRGVLVILDSTVLMADRFLESNDLRLLLNAARGGELRVGVAEVTLREAVNKVRENADEALRGIHGGSESLRKLRVSTADFLAVRNGEYVLEVVHIDDPGGWLKDEAPKL